MKNDLMMDFSVDKENKRINVERKFNASPDLVWAAWTRPEILDQWWAPKPWKAETKSMRFKEGGRWHYCMVGPDGERQWCLFDYKTIDPEKSYSGLDAFCDDEENVSNTKPRAFWENVFTGNTDSTTVSINIRFDELSDMEALLEMGFKEGFTMGMENLDRYLASRATAGKPGK